MPPLDIVAADPKFSATRKVSLYSNFERLRDTNQYGFEANIAAWRSVLLRCVSEGCFDNKTMLDTEGLATSLSDPTNGAPRALYVVIDEMVAQRDLVPLQAWLAAKRPLLRTTWSAAAALSWAWSRVYPARFSSGTAASLKPQQYVSVEAVKRAAERLYSRLQQQSQLKGNNITSKVVACDGLRGLEGLTDQDVEACVVYLSREQGKPISYDKRNQFIVLDSSITEEYQSIAAIRRQMAVLETRSESLQRRVEQLEGEARAAVRAKQTATAKQKLRSKREIEASLAKTLASSAQLESILTSVDTASDQTGVLDVLEKSARLLKTVNSAAGSPDRVAEIVDSINEQMADTEEIGSELARVSLEPEDVEDELDALEAEVKSSRLDKLKVPKDPLKAPQAEAEPEPEPEAPSPDFLQRA